MLFAILGILLICFVCSMMNKSSKQEERNRQIHEEQQQAFARQASADAKAFRARRIEAFQSLLKEEFPSLAEKFTYSVAEAYEVSLFAAANDPYVNERKKMFNKRVFKSEEAQDEAGNYMLEKAFSSFPQELQNAINAVEGGTDKVASAFNASKTLAG